MKLYWKLAAGGMEKETCNSNWCHEIVLFAFLCVHCRITLLEEGDDVEKIVTMNFFNLIFRLYLVLIHCFEV